MFLIYGAVNDWALQVIPKDFLGWLTARIFYISFLYLLQLIILGDSVDHHTSVWVHSVIYQNIQTINKT